MLLTLPCAGIIRTGSKGVLSPGRPKCALRRPGPLASTVKVRRNAAPGNACAGHAPDGVLLYPSDPYGRPQSIRPEPSHVSGRPRPGTH